MSFQVFIKKKNNLNDELCLSTNPDREKLRDRCGVYDFSSSSDLKQQNWTLFYFMYRGKIIGSTGHRVVPDNASLVCAPSVDFLVARHFFLV